MTPSPPLRLVAETGRHLTGTRSLDVALRTIVSAVARSTAAARAAVILRGPDGSVMRFHVTRDRGAGGTAVAAEQTDRGAVDILALLLRDSDSGAAVHSELVASGPALGGTGDARSAFLGVPIRLHNETLGTLYLVGNLAGGPFSAEDELVVEHFAHQAALTIGGAGPLRQARERADRLTELGKLTRFIRSTDKIPQVYDAVAKAAALLLGAAVARVWERDGTSDRVELVGGYAADPAFAPADGVRPCGRALAAEIVRTRRARYLTDVPAAPSTEGAVSRPRFGAYAGVPISTARRSFGVLALRFTHPRRFMPEDKELMALLAGSAALAIEAAHLSEETERRHREAEVRANIGRTMNATLDLDAVLPAVAEAARELSGADAVLVALRAPGSDAWRFRYWIGTRYRHYERLTLQTATGLAGHAIATGRPARSDDLLDDPRTDRSHLEVIETEGFRTALLAPMRIGERIDGLLCVANRERRSFTDRDESALLGLADQAAIAIRNAHLYGEAERRSRVAEALAGVARRILELAPIDEVASRIVTNAQRLVSAQSAQLFRVHGETGNLVSLATSGDLPPFVRDEVVVMGGPAGLAVRERRPVVVGDRRPDARAAPDAASGRGRGTATTALAAPLVLQDRIVGVLLVHHRPGRAFDGEDVRLVEQFAQQAALALETAPLYAETRGHPSGGTPAPALDSRPSRPAHAN